MCGTYRKMNNKHFFKPSCLVFKNSGHALTLSDRNYRCVSSCKGECDKKEPQINQRTLERSFADMAKNFEIEEASFGKLYRKMLVDYLPVLIVEAEEKAEAQDEILKATLAVMKQEVEAGKKIKKSDEKDFKEAFSEEKNASYILVLFAYLVAVVSIFSKKEHEKDFGKTLALITKHVYLSDKGKIEGIELEKWGWYIINFIDKNYPDYLLKLRQNSVNILNVKEDFCDFKPLEAVHYFESQNIEIAISEYKTFYYYNLLTKIQNTTEILMTGNTDAIPRAMLELFTEFGKDPQVIFATHLSIIARK